MNAAQQKYIERLQMKDSMRLFNEMTETCFGTCVHKFTSKDLGKSEQECIESCGKKFLAHQKRVGMRFAELNFQQQQQMQQT
jgi:mitochondrial import inner membrane translocase subunit TIM9